MNKLVLDDQARPPRAVVRELWFFPRYLLYPVVDFLNVREPQLIVSQTNIPATLRCDPVAGSSYNRKLSRRN